PRAEGQAADPGFAAGLARERALDEGRRGARAPGRADEDEGEHGEERGGEAEARDESQGTAGAGPPGAGPFPAQPAPRPGGPRPRGADATRVGAVRLAGGAGAGEPDRGSALEIDVERRGLSAPDLDFALGRPVAGPDDLEAMPPRRQPHRSEPSRHAPRLAVHV